MVTDVIGDYLTRIRNAQQAGHKVVDIPASNLKKRITEILYENGYILRYKFEDSDNKQGIIRIALKYDAATSQPVIKEMQRVSRPGLRKYVGVEGLPRVINGLGLAIVSTNQGVMTDKDARTKKVGGEVLCYIY
jgi:small subunit ribosomal protein S8